MKKKSNHVGPATTNPSAGFEVFINGLHLLKNNYPLNL